MSSEVAAALSAIGKALLNVTLAMGTGYWLKSSKIISDETLGGMGAFGGVVSLPALLFKAVATLDLMNVPLDVIAAITLGKLLLLVVGAIIGRICSGSRRFMEPPSSLSTITHLPWSQTQPVMS